jgi:uncharacterized RDD family membrane protein YckC
LCGWCAAPRVRLSTKLWHWAVALSYPVITGGDERSGYLVRAVGCPEMARSPTEVLGRRIGAAVIDLLLIVLLFFLVGLLFGQSYSGHGRAGVRLHGFSFAVWAILSLAYYLLTEIHSGQTIGKRLLGIAVVNQAGGTPTARAVALRTLLRIVDFLPFFYLLGLLSVLSTGRRAQRIGDLVAGTTVAAVSQERFAR